VGLTLLVIVTLVSVAAFLARSAERSILFPARRAGDASALLAAAGGESFWLEAADARTEAWFLPVRGAHTPRGPLVVFTHGNGELIDDWAREWNEPRSWGLSVLLVEYPGYGRSGGSPSESGIAATILAAYDAAAQRSDVDPRRIVAYGRSLGGGAASVLAAERPLAGLVLESSFTSVRDIARALRVPGFLVADPFDNVSRLAAFRGPTLILHGERDEVVPVEHGRALHEALPQSELVILRDCGHNDCPRPWPKLRQFLASHELL
jgi:pimeloyl-ACP methyl ester carboxylesterase